MALLLVYVGFALGVSFLCSLLEAALLSVRNSGLAQRMARGHRGAAHLLEIRKGRIDDAISAILTLNTVSNTLGATLAGAQAARFFGEAWVGVFSGVLTLLILTFSEIIPKTLGSAYALPLSGFVGWTLHYLTLLMRPVIFLTRSITRLLAPAEARRFSKGELATIISTAAQDGALSGEESRIFANLLNFGDIKIGDVMTPRSVAVMLPVDAPVSRLIDDADAEVFSRVPVFAGERDNVVGYVLQRDLLIAVARGCDRGQTLERFARPIHFIPEMASVDSALRQILERREPIAMVTDEHGGVEGLITLEDLTETILGVEIVDELDRIPDMREAAKRLRDVRLDRLRQKLHTDPEPRTPD